MKGLNQKGHRGHSTWDTVMGVGRGPFQAPQRPTRMRTTSPHQAGGTTVQALEDEPLDPSFPRIPHVEVSQRGAGGPNPGEVPTATQLDRPWEVGVGQNTAAS